MDKVKTILSKMPKVKVKMPKVKANLPKPNLKPWLEKLKPYVSKAWEVLKKAPQLGLKALKGLLVWFGKAVKESIAQLWTLLGFFIAWLTLTGTAQQIVGLATIFVTILWLATISLREENE
jgi:G:T-mismatch repair DNA endonuclease (very short patch repair protein)